MVKKLSYKQTEVGGIPEGWKKFLIGDLFELIPGYAFKSQDFRAKGIPVLKIKNVKAGRVVLDDLSYVDHTTMPQKQKYGVKKDDLLITMSGNRIDGSSDTWVGKVAQFKHDGTYLINQRIGILRSKSQEFNSSYCAYSLASYDYQLHFINMATSSGGQANISPEMILSTVVKLPSYKEQNVIAKILSDLDAKIELNRQMNKTLESIAQAIFKRWFVDFEFPGYEKAKFVNGLPQGWKVNNLGENGTFKNGINYLRDEIGDTDFFIANVRDIANNKLLLKDSLDKIQINLNKAKEYLLQEKDILIARSASPGEISLVLGNLDKVIYSGFSIRYRLNNPSIYLYIFHIMQGLKKNLQNYSIGTTLQSVNQETLKNMRFILPSDETLKEFNRISEQILDKTLNNLLQNRELSQIRDSLLPRLMSGQIRVGVS